MVKTCLIVLNDYSFILHVQLGTDSFDGYYISDDKKYDNYTKTTFKTNFKHRSIQIYRIPSNESGRKTCQYNFTTNIYFRP